MDDQLFIGRIHIVEWLRSGDLKTGWELFGEVQPLGLATKPQIETFFHSIGRRGEFVALLRSVEEQFRADGVIPLLHIETHGNADGIGISDDEGFRFVDLARELTPLNLLTGLRLSVVLGACEGLWGINMLLPSDRAAFLVILGPIRQVTGGEVAAAMQAFYRSALVHGSGDKAVTAMNETIDRRTPTFGLFNAEMGFKMVYQKFMAQRCTPEAIERAVEEMNAERGALFLAVRGVARSNQQIALDRASIRKMLEDHEANFQEFRSGYFMIDLFPANDKRFPITLADLQKDGPP